MPCHVMQKNVTPCAAMHMPCQKHVMPCHAQLTRGQRGNVNTLPNNYLPLLKKIRHPIVCLALWYTASGVGLNMLMRSTVP